MTITTSTNKFRYQGNGVTDTFAFSSRIFSASDLVVEIITRATDALVETLTITTDYTVTINSDESASVVVVSGKIPSATQDIQIRRALAQTQTLDLPTGTVFPAVSVENALDRITALTQDVSEILDRTVTLSVTSSATAPTVGDLTSSEVVVYDGTSFITNGLSTTNLANLNAISADITTVAGISSDVTAVAADITDIGTVATNIADINTTANNIAAIITAAGLVTGFLTSNNTWTGTNVFEGQTTIDDGLLGGNMSGASTHKLVNMADGTNAQDYVTKAQLDAKPEGGLVLLGSYTASNVTSVDIGSGLDLDITFDSSSDIYIFELEDLVCASNNDFQLRTGNGGVFDSGASDYGYNSIYVSGSVGQTRSTGAAQIRVCDTLSASSTQPINGYIIMRGSQNSSVNTRFEFNLCFDTGGALAYNNGWGERLEQAVHDRVRLFASTGNITSGVVRAYKINNS